MTRELTVSDLDMIACFIANVEHIILHVYRRPCSVTTSQIEKPGPSMQLRMVTTRHPPGSRKSVGVT